MSNFYEILNSCESDSVDDIKLKYKQLILQYHPDKFDSHNTSIQCDTNNTITNNPSSPSDNNEFVQINKAWNTLKDPAKRKLYDAELYQIRFQMHSNIFERLKLCDIQDSKLDHINCKTYPCRCGGEYIVYDDQFVDIESNEEIFIECNECSLTILVTK